MSFPTLYGKLTDTYTTTTKPDSLVVGQRWRDMQTGKEYMFVLANGTITASGAVKFDESVAATTFKVIDTAAATDAFLGVNNSGASVASGVYFWIQIKGFATVLVAASQSAGDILAPSGTAATLTVGSAAAVQTLCGILAADSGAGGAVSVFLL
jgi:hypothetical protein